MTGLVVLRDEHHLVGPTGTKDTYVQLEANGTVSSLKLKNENGREQIIKP